VAQQFFNISNIPVLLAGWVIGVMTPMGIGRPVGSGGCSDVVFLIRTGPPYRV